MTVSRTTRAQAAAWLAKLHGPERTPQLEADFRRWLQESPAHSHAFEQITETWDSITAATTAGLPRRAVFRVGESPHQPRRLRGVVVAAAAVILTVCTAFLLRSLEGDRYTTTVGEQRIITLSDGTRLTLNSDSHVEVEFSQTERRVTLERGEAYFEVAKSSGRPFRVAAGGRTVTALGTAFDVRRDRKVTTVTLIEGKIAVSSSPEEFSSGSPQEISAEVSPTAAAAASTVTLLPGQRLTFGAGGGTDSLDKPKPEVATAWRRGEVVLDETPLAAAVGEMNRYERQQIVIDSGAIAELPISGIYRTGDSAGFAAAVAAAYNLQTSVSGREIHLHR